MSNERKGLPRPELLEMSLAEMEDAMAEVPESKWCRPEWTPEMNRMLLRYYHQKDKAGLAKFFGVSRGTLRNRYRRLMEDGDETVVSD